MVHRLSVLSERQACDQNSLKWWEVSGANVWWNRRRLCPLVYITPRLSYHYWALQSASIVWALNPPPGFYKFKTHKVTFSWWINRLVITKSIPSSLITKHRKLFINSLLQSVGKCVLNLIPLRLYSDSNSLHFSPYTFLPNDYHFPNQHSGSNL